MTIERDMPSDPKLIRQEIRKLADACGFDLFGIAAAQPSPAYDRFREWIDRGYAGTMKYLVDRIEAYAHPNSVLEQVASVIMLGASYHAPGVTNMHDDNRPHRRDDDKANDIEDGGSTNKGRDDLSHDSRLRPLDHQASTPGKGRVASYAGADRDYHDVIHEKLKWMKAQMLSQWPEMIVRGVVDTAPLLERDFARLAGLGWIGKNTLLLSRHHGSYFFLAALLINVSLPADEPFLSDHCGNCTACLDACPTQAFPQPRVLDATRCISYLTIEHRDNIPVELRAAMSDWVFGCDICQTVCPWNRKALPSSMNALHPRAENQHIDLLEMLRATDDTFREQYRHTPLWRTKKRGMLRNAMIAIGNQRLQAARQDLEQLTQCDDEVLRETAAWALQQLDTAKQLDTVQPLNATKF